MSNIVAGFLCSLFFSFNQSTIVHSIKYVLTVTCSSKKNSSLNSWSDTCEYRGPIFLLWTQF